MRIPRVISSALAGVTLAAGLTVATATPASAVQVCREAWVGRLWVGVACVTGEVFLNNNTTAEGGVAVDCVLLDFVACSIDPVYVGATGFEPNLRGPQLVEVDPATASVRTNGFTLGYLWVNGVPTAVRVPGFCVGDPTYC